jgi:hypothetical protein
MSSIQGEDKIQVLFPGSPYPALGIYIRWTVGRVNDMSAFSLEEGAKERVTAIAQATAYWNVHCHPYCWRKTFIYNHL